MMQDQKKELGPWISGLCPWNLAVSLTFRRTFLDNQVSEEQMHAAIRHFLNLIDRACFRSGGRRKRYRVGSFAVLGNNSLGTHPHCHLALAMPPHLGYDTCVTLVVVQVRRVGLLNQQFKIDRYGNSRWIEYCLRHKTYDIHYDLLRRLSC